MSAATRSALADAANAADDRVKVTPYFHQTTRAGSGFVRLDRLTRDDTGFGFIATWQVVILLPTDQGGAEKWIDARLNTLLEALDPEGFLTGAQPVQLSLDNGTVPALVISLTREQE